MENLTPPIFTGTKDLNELKKIRDAATKQIKRIRDEKTIRIPAYVPAELREKLDVAVAYAYFNGFIKKQTRWAFAKFAVANAITLIINQKKQEDAEKALLETQEVPQIIPNEIIPNSQIDFPP